MDQYVEARKYFHVHYKELMSLFGMIYAQLETEDSKSTPVQLSAKSAYYTVISHLYLKNHDVITLIDAFIRNNSETDFNGFEGELAVALLTESKIHELESRGLLQIKRDKHGNTEMSLTEKGQKLSEQQKKDLLDFK